MTRLTLPIAIFTCTLSTAPTATTQQYDSSDFNFISRLFDFGDGTNAEVKTFQKKKNWVRTVSSARIRGVR